MKAEINGKPVINEREVEVIQKPLRSGLKSRPIQDLRGEIRVRHHTSPSAMSNIKSSGVIYPSRTAPIGVDMEVSPFLSPNKVNVGQFGKGAYIEFSVPQNLLSPIPGYMGGTGNVGRIIINSPLNIQNATPTFHVWQWWRFGL